MSEEPNSPTTERIQHLERLVEISRMLCDSLDLEPFLHTLVALASELTSCEAASILEPDDDGQNLRFLAIPWFHREVLKSVKVPLQNSVAGWVFQNAQTLIVEDVAKEPRHYKGVDKAAEFTTRSLMAVPIVYQGSKLGVLEVINKTGSTHYTEDDRTILETLAANAAIAIQNALLRNKVQKNKDGIDELNRMKSDFIGIASHELRTPLGLILGHATFLRETIEPAYQSQLDIIVRNSIRLKEIIDNIASMDNVERGTVSLRPHTVSIRRIVEEVMDSFQQESQKKHISMRSDLGEEDLVVEGDASKISIAMSNMVQNAIIFSKPEGSVVIRAEKIPGYIKISVIDDGIGIPSKDLPHIFERFYQVELHLTRRHGGMGLGLSVAKVMIEMHGGRVWAESVEGKGSNFTFILPLMSTNGGGKKPPIKP